MFIAIYSFQVKPEKESEFIETWEKLTELIYKHEGSLGSRLHKASETEYIAYAQWPSNELWENAGSKLPENANSIRETMKSCCEKI